MQIQLSTAPLNSLETGALAVIVPQREPRLSGPLAELDRATNGRIGELVKAGEISGRFAEMTLLHQPPGLAAGRLLIVGGGMRDCGPYEMRRLAGAAARHLAAKGVRQMVWAVPAGAAPAAALIAASIEGVIAGQFETARYKQEPAPARRLEHLTLHSASTGPEAEAAIARGEAIGEAINLARELANEPGNRMTPRLLAECARQMAESAGLECDVIDENRARELKMEAFLAVAQGSAEPPRMIVLRYRGAGARPGAPVLGLVGKGITFDTGGISIKPADGMEKMKYDMSGGAGMIAVMRALARLRPALEVIAVIPAAENMPGGRAQKPGDVQIAMSGKSIEVLNTDAEGRMVLADGLTYARQLGATHLLDAATLTGAVAVALGTVNAGVFANDDAFYADFESARARAGEKMWRLPLDEEYADQIQGTVGDLLNTGGRWGGAITAAEFLHAFAETTPWIHLDIAGLAWLDEGKPWMPKGPSGVGVATLVELALLWAERQAGAAGMI